MWIFLLLLIIISPLQAFEYDAFVDTYYAFDSGRQQQKRPYTTQPVQHDRPGINLIYGGINFNETNIRSRLALQAGDSVERNAATEPGINKYIQEAYLGFQLSENTWIDGGIFLSHIGMESWISKYNDTYTRSLLSDYVPYYSAGARLEHKINSHSSLQFYILQGWQTISENNNSKAMGLQYHYRSFTYNNFLGHEQVVSETDLFRHYHNFIFEKVMSKNLKLKASLDIGIQDRPNHKGQNAWGAAALTLKQTLSETKGLGYRLEHYLDPHQSNVPTGTPNGFQVSSASLNYDQEFNQHILWRSEVRSFYSRDKIYDSHRWNGLFVTSIGLSL